MTVVTLDFLIACMTVDTAKASAVAVTANKFNYGLKRSTKRIL